MVDYPVGRSFGRRDDERIHRSAPTPANFYACNSCEWCSLDAPGERCSER
jgi:hypothetical protein